nr:hypothetical protein 17 [bacterium]
MNLSDFLSAANDDDAKALAEARAHIEQRHRLLTSDVVTMILLQTGTYAVLEGAAAGPDRPAKYICKAVLDRVRTNSLFNFMPGDEKGELNLGLLDSMINSLLIEHADALTNLKAAILSETSAAIKPFENATLYEVKKARARLDMVSVGVVGGYAVLENTAYTENHSPDVFALNPRTAKLEHIGVIPNVSSIGIYDFPVPRQWRGAALLVGDAYGHFKAV